MRRRRDLVGELVCLVSLIRLGFGEIGERKGAEIPRTVSNKHPHLWIFILFLFSLIIFRRNT